MMQSQLPATLPSSLLVWFDMCLFQFTTYPAAAPTAWVTAVGNWLGLQLLIFTAANDVAAGCLC